MAIRITNQNIQTVRTEKMQTAETKLSAQDIQRLAGVRTGDQIVCTQGVLWVTQEGDRSDYMLRKGEQFVANRHGVVVVQALTDAACHFSKN